MNIHRRFLSACLLFASLSIAPGASAETRAFPAGSLIVPMDLTYQDHGMFQAYGLLFQWLRQGITVYWVIDSEKTWHPAPCNEPADPCPWDCEEEGSGEKCPYPTAAPDFYASAEVLWDDAGTRPPGTIVNLHGYRGGPFVVDAADADAALEIADIWNNQDQWVYHPWAQRSVFSVVSLHRTRAPFDGNVRKIMNAAPTIAVFSDGNENIATSYLRAAGIPQSSGAEFPAAKCTPGNCGPGTANPDMLTVESIMGDMGTCDNPNYDHRNGALFTADNLPAYCQIMSMHWNVAARETVKCDGGNCPAAQDQCQGMNFTYHGHEVVAEVREFLQHRTHFFAECQAVNAYENLVPNPAWPYLDDAGRRGHFLTTAGTPPDCPCTDPEFQCVTGGCDNGTRDCCIPRDVKEQGAGYMIAAQPASDTIKILHAGVPYMQMDGAFSTVGGSEPAYNLSETLGSEYINDMDVTFITGPDGPGKADVWMTGYIDGECSIVDDDVYLPQQCTKGKVSYLGGHQYTVTLPLSSNGTSQGTRLFLNALFEADCVSAEGQPRLVLSWVNNPVVAASADALPAIARLEVRYVNAGGGGALDAVLHIEPPADAGIPDYEPGGVVDAEGRIVWTIGSIGASGSATPPASGARWLDASFPQLGDYTFTADLAYRVGVSTLHVRQPITIRVLLDSDGDGIADEFDPFPLDPARCGDADGDNCDDCAGACSGDAGTDEGGNTSRRDNSLGHCHCRSTGSSSRLPAFLSLVFLLVVLNSLCRR